MKTFTVQKVDNGWTFNWSDYPEDIGCANAAGYGAFSNNYQMFPATITPPKTNGAEVYEDQPDLEERIVEFLDKS